MGSYTKPLKSLMHLAVMICLILSFGCSAKPRVELVGPPESMMMSTAAPPVSTGMEAAAKGKNYRAYSIAATDHILEWNLALAECNADKEALLIWSKAIKAVDGAQ